MRATTVVSQPDEIAHLVAIAAAEPQPGVLHRVLGLGQGTQHAVGKPGQARPVRLEPLGKISFVHRSHPDDGLRHAYDGAGPADVTGRAAKS